MSDPTKSNSYTLRLNESDAKRFVALTLKLGMNGAEALRYLIRKEFDKLALQLKNNEGGVE